LLDNVTMQNDDLSKFECRLSFDIFHEL